MARWPGTHLRAPHRVALRVDDDSLDAAWQMVKNWTAEERLKLRYDVPKLGFKATIGGRDQLVISGCGMLTSHDPATGDELWSVDAIAEATEKLKNWGRWGRDDQIGTLNHVQPEDIVKAALAANAAALRTLGQFTDRTIPTMVVVGALIFAPKLLMLR